jgi:hypothetical protein
MTGDDVITVPEPYDRETSDTCDYEPPRLSLSTSGNRIIATIKKGTYSISGYTLYINGTEKSGISVGADGTVLGYTLTGKESSVKLMISDSAGYTAVSEITLTPTEDDGDGQQTNIHHRP